MTRMTSPIACRHERERGQVLVVFTLALVVLIGMVGLILDGGSTFAQRRDEQNVADLAAMAGATAFLNTAGTTDVRVAAAEAAARLVAAGNGYVPGADGVAVDVTVSALGPAARVRVDVRKPHENTFSGLLGQPRWQVSSTATAETSGAPNGAAGAMPIIFNEVAFDDPGPCDRANETCTPTYFNEPGTGSEDVPQDATQFNWSVYCVANGNPCNANSDTVRDLIVGNGTDEVVTVGPGMQIGPLNAGAHTTLFEALAANALGDEFPVSIVCTVNNDPDCPEDGTMVGWAIFHLSTIEGDAEKVLSGYFISPVQAEELSFVPGGGTARPFGGYELKLID